MPPCKLLRSSRFDCLLHEPCHWQEVASSEGGWSADVAAGNVHAKPGSAKARQGCTMDRELEQKLREFVMFKTVSSDRSLREDCYRGAKYLCRLLTEVLGEQLQQIEQPYHQSCNQQGAFSPLRTSAKLSIISSTSGPKLASHVWIH